jgi:hypothetical protein
MNLSGFLTLKITLYGPGNNYLDTTLTAYSSTTAVISGFASLNFGVDTDLAALITLFTSCYTIVTFHKNLFAARSKKKGT